MNATDAQWMARALKLAERGIYRTSPNPSVGCVLVKGEHILGEGTTEPAGQWHAEIVALAQSGNKAQGATAYVTLEPCSHYGRTPCAKSLVEAKVARVVIAMLDPNPLVAGRGIAILEEAGIEVTLLSIESEAIKSVRGFCHRMRTKRPFVQVKLAASLDGKTALANGESQWITGPDARRDVQQFRAQSCAILTGADTILADDPSLNVRWHDLPKSARQAIESEVQLRQPLRIILDSQNRISPQAQIIQQKQPILRVTTVPSLQNWPAWVEEVIAPEHPSSGKVDLDWLLDELGRREINQLWVEAGGHLAGAFCERQLLDELILYFAPKLMGDSAQGLLQMQSFSQMKEVVQGSLKDVRQIGNDVRMIFKPE